MLWLYKHFQQRKSHCWRFSGNRIGQSGQVNKKRKSRMSAFSTSIRLWKKTPSQPFHLEVQLFL